MQLDRKAALRTIWRRLHLVLGTICGIVLIVVCTTGGLYLFRNEIARIVEPERYYVDRNNVKTMERKNLDELVEKLERETEARIETLVIPLDPDRTWRALLKGTGAKNRRILCEVDPYTGEIAGIGADKVAPFFKGVRRWHTRLNINKSIGRPIVEVSSAVMLVLLVSGIVLRFPRTKKQILRLFTVKWNGSRNRLLFDLHNAAGIYTLIPLTILAITGILFAVDDRHANYAPKTALGSQVETNSPAALETMVQECRSLRGKGELKINFPKNKETGAFSVEHVNGGFFSFVAPSVLYWDGNVGKVIKTRSFRDLNGKERFDALVRACHYGDVFGLFSKLIFGLGCLGGVILSVTGYLYFLVRKSKPKNDVVEASGIKS